MTGNHRAEIFFWLGAFALFFLTLYLLSPILLPFVASGIIAYFLDPAVTWLERWKFPRWLATVLVLVLFGLILTLLIALLLPLLRLQATELTGRLPALLEQAKTLLDQWMQAAALRLPPEDYQKLHDTLTGSAGDLLAWAIRQVQSIFTSGLALANLLSLVVVTPIVAFFLLRDWNRIVRTVDGWLPRDHRDTIREQARLVDMMLGGYIRGQLLVCLGLAIYYAGLLTVVGLDFGLILGIFVGILAFIPYLGFIGGAVLATGLALLQFSHSWNVLWVLAIFAFGSILETALLSPKLVGERVRLHPVWVIFSLFAFGTLFGFLGVLIALPAAAVAGVLVRFALSRYLASPLYEPRTPETEAEEKHPRRKRN
jgi:predicted PurR-regulated permease PerM